MGGSVGRLGGREVNRAGLAALIRPAGGPRRGPRPAISALAPKTPRPSDGPKGDPLPLTRLPPRQRKAGPEIKNNNSETPTLRTILNDPRWVMVAAMEP